MDLFDVISLLGGVALFLFGMSLMGDSLKKVAGNKLELILYTLTSNPFKGFLLGTGVTAIIQSSSATSVITQSEANFAWNEWGIFNAATGGVMLNRVVESNGTKQNNQTWILDISVTFTIGS